MLYADHLRPIPLCHEIPMHYGFIYTRNRFIRFEASLPIRKRSCDCMCVYMKEREREKEREKRERARAIERDINTHTNN